MKSLSKLLFGLFCAGASLAPGQEEDIPLGIEAVTGFRSDYVYRGFHLAQATMDFQVETEIVISDILSLGVGGWAATQLDDGFNERIGFIDLARVEAKKMVKVFYLFGEGGTGGCSIIDTNKEIAYCNIMSN